MRRSFAIAVAVVAIAAALGVVAFTTLRRGEGQEDDLLEKTNRKFERLGFPTLGPEGFPTAPPAPVWIPTAGPSPTPTVPDCAGGSISGAEQIVAQYGSARASCLAAGRYLWFEISGWYDTTLVDDQGGIAVYACSASDTCEPDQPLAEPASWIFYPASAKGRFKVRGFFPPETLLVLGGNVGQACFNLRTGKYVTELPCIVEPTVPPGRPWPVTPYVEPTPVNLGTPPSE